MHPWFLIGAMLMSTTAGDPAMPPPVASLVEAERAFAKMAETVSVRDAFLANLADGALLFNPGPVDGRALYEGRAPSAVLLAWQPVYAEIAASADFGFTTGPWSFSPDRESDPVAFGHFVSVWKKPAGGSWKVAVDIGIGHERMPATPALTFRTSDDPDPWPRDAAGMAEKRAGLLAADAAFAEAFARGAAGAFGAWGAPDVRRYRDGAAPVLGRAAVMAAAGAGGGGVMRATDADVAPSGDLGYTAGYRGAPVAAYYVRIWRLEENRVWKVVLDIESAVPEGD
ncbi:MAG: nuclear transport factor 2 family protein [Candidatus Krumholzibacteria bacterium]|nr:nuclear transport factor 2 family protein [Candidatus Krumholzibacteria bacterium]MDH4337210.1 nuclear transport factor 2 family protein [Candidatus Krumholzibacteria bacterium]MDH5268672.1 nuclear transport factor 2 family protein [Candidatus Krumholzibacteria bacterium]